MLLVIIATAYVTRTGAARTGSNAYERAQQADDNQQVIAEDLAGSIAEMLFVRALDPALFAPGYIADANDPRLPVSPGAVRYDLDANFPYNFAPYEVIPWTNWPDAFMVPDATLWPAGAGNVGGGTGNALLRPESNPLGNPGFGDARPLRDLEPMRQDTNGDGIPDAFSHWRHMTNIARPDNAWRIVYNTANIEASLFNEMNIPVEQWLAAPPDPSRFNGVTGDAIFDPTDFEAQWLDWFGGLGSYQSSYMDAFRVPHNFYRLSSLDGDDIIHEPGERPTDEFVGPGMADAQGNSWPDGTPRWRVSRVLADTDGDGYTDSFWFLAPSSVQSGVRQIVAVSIIDNAAMLDANVATRFFRNDAIPFAKTYGLTPTDLTMVGNLDPTDFSSNWNVGFFDNPDHDYLASDPSVPGVPFFDFVVNATATQWQRYLNDLGLITGVSTPMLNMTRDQRLDYWRHAASSPLSSSPFRRYTPFALSDELELRMYAGQNYPWSFSRFEHAVQPNGAGFLRAGVGFEENSEYLEQLVNRGLLLDHRHRLTMYNNTRNDIMPRWLWMYEPGINLDGLPGITQLDLDLFNAGARKFDLRMPYGVPLAGDFDGDGDAEFVPTPPGCDAEDVGIHLRDRLEVALMDPATGIFTARNTYYGNDPADIDRTHELCAALAANIREWRDRATTGIEEAPLSEAVPVKATLTNPSPQGRYIGLEPQPFIVEAFIAHVYKGTLVEPPQYDGPPPVPYTNAGDYVLTANVPTDGPEDKSGSVIVVQIANPFNETVDLTGYELSVFGQSHSLSGTLDPATDDGVPGAPPKRPVTALYYSISSDVAGDAMLNKWIEFLDLGEHSSSSDIIEAVPAWSTQRSTYDTASTEGAVELIRRDPGGDAVVIDRIDPPNDRKFGDEVNALLANAPPVVNDPPGDYAVSPPGQPYGVNDAGAETLPDGYTHWAQWVRATRAWGIDLDADGEYDPNERNPRYVFGDHAIIKPETSTDPAFAPVLNGGNPFKLGVDPENDPVTGRPWFARDYYLTDNPPSILARKPTFFDMNWTNSGIANYPDKGWYSQGGGPDDPTRDPSGNPLYRLRFPMQMLHKNRDFEQVGEILNVFLYGHKLTMPGGVYSATETTFSEFMGQPNLDLVGGDLFVNRLRLRHDAGDPLTSEGGRILGIGDPGNAADVRHAIPDLPAGVRALDMFVCDSFGVALGDISGPTGLPDGIVDGFDREAGTLFNAKNFTGSGSPGLINLNTAPPEVLRALPHWYRLVHERGGAMPSPSINPYYNAAGQPLVTNSADQNALLPRVMLPEAVQHYRERFNGWNPAEPIPTGIGGGANYTNRPGGARGERGFASIGELLMLDQPGEAQLTRATAGPPDDQIYHEQWRLDQGVTIRGTTPKPFWDAAGGGANQISLLIGTDRQDEFDPASTNPRPDSTAGDSEEAALLFSGVSNLITTRSDVFTVYFRVRSFRQNTSVNPPIWDATNPEYIVEDSRYVMLVDRSEVNTPGDKPRILYMEKLPN